MATWGQIRFELAKGRALDLQLLNGWINAAYRQILDHHSWKGLEGDAVLQTIAPYAAGTAAVTNGSAAVTGTGTTWTSGMTGREFRVEGRGERYTFTYVSATAGTLDRNYEGDTEAAAGYSIFKRIYNLPADAKYVKAMQNPRIGAPVLRKTRDDLNEADPSRVRSGPARIFAPHSDSDEASPPVLHRVEIYPVPDAAEGLPFSYEKAVSEFTGSNTTDSPLPWVSEDAIKAGALVRIYRHVKDAAGEASARADFRDFVAGMVRVEAARVGPARLRMDPRYTAHRRQRWAR
jgi:hypothetical protein